MRFAQKITIKVNLLADTTQGIIYPPGLEIEYSSVSLNDAQNGAEVEVSTCFLLQVVFFTRFILADDLLPLDLTL